MCGCLSSEKLISLLADADLAGSNKPLLSAVGMEATDCPPPDDDDLISNGEAGTEANTSQSSISLEQGERSVEMLDACRDTPCPCDDTPCECETKFVGVDGREGGTIPSPNPFNVSPVESMSTFPPRTVPESSPVSSSRCTGNRGAGKL